VPRQKSSAQQQKKKCEIQTAMGARWLIFQQIIEVARALVAETQERRAANR
jgi:hypothetical protein